MADVVAEEAAKRLLPDLNLERKAKKAERIGIGVAKRLALVQADIWAKRGAGDIYELEPLLAVEETCTRSAIEDPMGLVDELAQQGHLLIRHNRGLKCKACNVYRADRQFSFWNRKLCVAMCGQSHLPILEQAKRRHNESFETVVFPIPSSGGTIKGQSGHPNVYRALTVIWSDSLSSVSSGTEGLQSTLVTMSPVLQSFH